MDDVHVRCLEQVTNTGAPFPIAVADQESTRSDDAIARIRELAADLPHEGLVWVWCQELTQASEAARV